MDSLLDVLKVLAALSLAGFGFYAAWQPHRAMTLIHGRATDGRGVAETRINLGGFFIGLGIVPIVMHDPAAYAVAGGAYLAAAVTRLLAYFLDSPGSPTAYFGLLVFEAAMGIILLV